MLVLALTRGLRLFPNFKIACLTRATRDHKPLPRLNNSPKMLTKKKPNVGSEVLLHTKQVLTEKIQR